MMMKKLFKLPLVIIPVLAVILTVSVVKNKINLRSKAAAGPPITGTWLMLDTFNKSEEFFDHYNNDLKEMGVDTVILLNSGDIIETPCNVSQKGTYQEKYFVETWVDIRNFLKSAKRNGMKVFLTNITNDNSCMPLWNGQLYNENTDKGRIIEANIRAFEAFKNYITSQGWDWDDPNFIQGFYLSHEVSIEQFLTDHQVFSYFTDISRRLKEAYPNKQISISPYKFEKTNYNTAYRAYKKLFSETSIDIVMPQDSMGTGKVKSYSRNGDQFRALRDAANQFSNKQAWDNVETFTDPDSEGPLPAIPTSIDKLAAQVESARPYVSKMVTWIWQHNLSIIPELDNTVSWTKQYTYENAVRRHQLRSQYYYKYFLNTSINTFVWGPNLVAKIPAVKSSGADVLAEVVYLDTGGSLQKVSFQTIVSNEDFPTLYLSLARLPGFNPNGLYSVLIKNLVIASDLPTPVPPATIQPTLPPKVPKAVREIFERWGREVGRRHF